ncbi:hypothetical protein BU16DRAFT_554701 [Lophium mytilinum]|uniref:BZIP domain-containing protein n=1 Tax=Lophium mytilinum TaxID=390894 RepID=A0A6A6RD29_9PEZI|nr:hypothetical protein BU16DRAFT_554701 [Lophium mytilinum]
MPSAADITKIEKQTTPPSEAPAAPSQPDSKPAPQTGSNAPLAPPPRPSQNGGQNGGPSDTPDYFNTVHNPFSLEPNVFEQSFGNPSAETPGGRPILPPVANITSPSPLPGITPGWQSLRAGPLSPAMLQGPTGDSDYFNQSFRGFPTPNESSLRTGLTPGGGGSMFPAPSPNSQAIFNLQSGGVTPSTADFQQSALRAAAQTKFPVTSNPTSQPDPAQHSYQQPQQPQHPQQQRNQQDIFGQHDVTGAANDLLSFAQATQANQPNGNRTNGQFAVPNQPAHMNNSMGHMPVQMPQDQQQTHHHNPKGSVHSITGSADTGDFSESGHSEQTKPSTRSRQKKGSNTKTTAASRRKADDGPKGGNKKQKGGSGSVQSHTADEDSDMDMDNMKEELNEHGKKMTDEEKRKNFLERNRVAALKCRQRKKQWLANLQNKVEVYGTENDALSAQVTQLREEIVNLKTLLLAHKDCSIGQAQGLNQMPISTFLAQDMGHHQNPYGMAGMQPNGVPMGMAMQQGQMNRR